MKISIVYVSQGGSTEIVAEYIEEGILTRFPFAQVKLMSIRDDEVDYEFLQQSEAVIFGMPVYCAGMGWELKKWFDFNVKLDLSGKLGAAFVTAQSPIGGVDMAIMGDKKMSLSNYEIMRNEMRIYWSICIIKRFFYDRTSYQ